jgi:hypothetical protein
MASTINTNKLQEVFSYPFKDPRWKNKLIIGAIMGLFSLLIVPIIFLVGYGYRIMKRVIVDKQPLALPEWDDWGQLFVDGLRLYALGLIYALPLISVFIVSYFSFLIPILLNVDHGGYEQWIPVGFLIFLVGMGISMVIGLPLQIIIPAALSHSVAENRFMAAFQFKQWWPIFKANISGFVLSAVIPLGTTLILTFISQLFLMTMVLCLLAPIASACASIYSVLITYALYAQAYVDAVEKRDELQ